MIQTVFILLDKSLCSCIVCNQTQGSVLGTEAKDQFSYLRQNFLKKKKIQKIHVANTIFYVFKSLKLIKDLQIYS